MIREEQNPPESETRANDLVGNGAATDLGGKLRAIRREFIACGGRLLSREELRNEIADRRGGVRRVAHDEENVR